ncbi:MAG: YeeE/YedE family protein [Aquabacterium sp.]
MTNFTPLAGLAGGALIGASAVLLLYALGRLAGISGITYAALRGPEAQEPWARWSWRPVFLIGLIAGGGAWAWWSGHVVARPSMPPWLLTVGGLLVGWGTSQGNGCTSGHGVCGMARLSPRSLAATLAFMAVGVATVFTVRHLLGAAWGAV